MTVLVPHVGGPIIMGSPTVIVGGMPQARMGDMMICVGPPDVIVMGEPTVVVGMAGMGSMGFGGLMAGLYAWLSGLPADEMARTIGLVGPDGVGKSTLLSLISGVKKTQTGRMQVLGGDIKVIQGVPGVDSALQQKVLLSIGADLAAAYDLEPAAPSRNKTVGFKEGEVRVTETERTVRLQQFKEVRGQSVPTHIVVQNTALNYTVNIDVERADLDVKLDPALFQLR